MRRKQGASGKSRQRRRLFLEALENRRLLVATDLASISGLVFDDFAGNGFDAGEEVSGAALRLYRDNGDGTFQEGSDTQVGSTTTGTDGRYEFNRLTAGGYFVLQDAQTVDGSTLPRSVSPLTTISSTNVEGRIVEIIDSFDLTTQLVFDDTADGVPVTSTILASEAIGGERDLFVNKTSVNGGVQLSVNDPLLPNLLLFDSIATGNGDRRITWDGPDGDATSVDDTGLGNEDLTSGSDALGLQLQIGADLAGGSAVVRLYSDDSNAGTANRFSSATLAIPQTGGTVSVPEFLPFSAFTATSGGGANFSNIGAIELEITGTANVNGSAELVGTVGQTIFTQDFANFSSADLSLDKTIDNATPSIGQNVTFTVTLSNSGPDTATNVAVRDQLPAGVTFVSSAPSQGTYSSGTGIWTVGTVNNGASPTLQLVGRIESAGARVNFAEVSASDQFDPNSTPDPDNSQPDDESENDQALVNFVTESIDLSLTKIAEPTTVVVGSNVNFTLTLSNAGPSQATGVIVQDQFPTGVTFFSAIASQGSYDSGTGQWNVGTVPSGSSPTLSLVGTVNVAGPKTNTAQVLAADQVDIDSTPGNNDPTEDDQASVTIEAPQIDLSLTKSASSSTVIVGENVTFTINLNNAGPSEATGVTVLDQLPSGVSFVSVTPSQGGYNELTGLWTVGTVGAGVSPTLTIVGRVDVAGPKTNTAQVQAADQPDLDSTPGNGIESEDDQESVTIQAPQIDLELTKSATPISVVVGTDVTFTLSLRNQGPSEATGVVVEDLLPAGISFVSSSPSQGTYDSATGLWSVGTIAASTAPTLTIVGRVDTPGSKTNTAQVNAADQPDVDSTPDNDVESEDDQDSVTIEAPQIDLSLVKSVDNSAPDVGENVTFTLVLANAGPDTATGVQVRDLLPIGLNFVSFATAAGTYNSGTGAWNVGSVNANSNATLTIIATPTTAAILTNSTEVIAADQPDPDSTPDNNVPAEDDQSSVMIGAQLIDLELSKTVDQSTPNVGDEISFEIVISNQGPSDATGVVVQDLLPAGLTFVSANASSGGYDSGTGRWTIGNLANTASQTLTLNARVDAVDAVVNSAEVIEADQVDRDSSPGNGQVEEDDQDFARVAPLSANLSLTKTVDNAQTNVGDTATFTLTVLNSGPDAATNVTVNDQLPPGITFVSATPSQGNYNAASGVWTVGTVGSGGQSTLQIVARIDSSGEKTNTAQVATSDQFDPNSTPGNSVESEDDQASVSVLPPVIDLSLDKQIDIARPNIGQTIRYTVVVNNDGPDNATGVVIADDLPTGLTFVGSAATSGSYDANTGRWTLGSIAANGSATLQIDATIDASIATTATATNVAEVFAADQFDSDSTPGNGNPNEDDYGSAEFTLAQADLSLTKSVDNATPNVGDDVVFTITTSNAGPDPATSVTVLDLLPPGLTFVSSSPDLGSYNSGTGVWDIADLAVNATTTLTLVATSTTADFVSNVAAVETVDQLDPDSTPGNGVPTEDDQASVEVRGQQIDLSLTKVVDDETPNLGDQVRFTLTATNSGPSQATGVSVRDVLPAGLTFQSSNASQGSYDVASGIWDIGTLANAGTVTLDLFAMVDGIITVVNSAEVITADQPDSDSTPDNGNALEDDQDSAPVVTQVADLSLQKTVDDDRPDVGQQVTFTLNLRNDGPNEATGISVKDELPDDLRFVSANASVGAYNNASGIWTVGGLAGNSNATLDIVAEVLNIGEKTNTAEVLTADQADPDSIPGNNLEFEDDQDSASVVPTEIDLSLEKRALPFRPSVGGNLTYVITLRNEGPDVATGVIVEDSLPAGVSFVSATPSVGTFNPSSGRWSVPSLAAAGTATLQLLTTVNEPGEPTNRAQVIAADQFDIDSVPGNDDGIDDNGNDEDDQAAVTVTTASSDLSLTKTVSDETPGILSNVTYTIIVTNGGPDAAEDVVILDEIPNGMLFVSANPSAGTYNSANGRWTLATLNEDQSQTLELVARVVTLGEKINTAEVIESSEFDPDSTPGNHDPAEDDQASVSLIPELVDLALTKIVDDPTPNVGDIVRFTLELTNQGPSTATGVVVADPLPDGLIATQVIPSQGVYDPVNGFWNVGNVLEGSRPTLEIDVRVTTPDARVNVAEVVATDQPDLDSTPGNGVIEEDDYAQVELTPQVADLALRKTVSNPTPDQNEEILFSVVVINEGPNDATNVLVRDILPDGVTFVRSTQSIGNYDLGSGLWTIPNIPANFAASLQLVVTVQSKVPISNTAEVIASDQFDRDSTPDNQVLTEDDIDSVTVKPRIIDVAVAATVDNDEPNPGEVVEMVFTVTNTGPDDATGLQVEVDLPEGLFLVTARPQRGTYNVPGNREIWNVGNLAVGQSVNLVITARALSRGTKRVQMQVMAHNQADIDSTPANNISSEDDQTELLVKVPLFSKRLFLASR